MEIFSAKKRERGVGVIPLLACALAFCAAPALADGPCTDAGALDKIEPIQSCEGKPANCQQCQQAIQKQKDKGKKKFDKSVSECQAGASGCQIKSDSVPDMGSSTGQAGGFYPFFTYLARLSCPAAHAAASGGQKDSSVTGKQSSSAAATCEKNAAAKTREAAKIADDCAKAIKAACSGIDEGDKAQQICQDASAKANQVASADDAKAQEAQSNADKNADNAKKDGGMPQIPQIPQMPQSPQDPTASVPTFSSATDASVTSATGTNAAVESSKLDNGTGASSALGLAASGATNTSTTTTPSYPTYGNAGAATTEPSQYGSTSPLGAATGGSSNGSGSVGGSGGGSSGSGTLNATGASSPLADKGATADGASPYEVGGGGGGKLGAPKGFKGGGEGDSVIADAAKDTFKADVGLAAARDPASDAKGDVEDPAEVGFTVFKMVKARYVELKKRGSI